MKKEEIIQAVNQYILEDKMNDARRILMTLFLCSHFSKCRKSDKGRN